MDAVPQSYMFTQFRSALEANWAATLDSLGVRWEYEPTTVTLPSGAVYIPDFHLPDIGVWVEVKGEGIPRVEKAREFASTVKCRCEGSCRCRWPGGQIVLIGHEAITCDTEAGVPMRYGAARWSDALGVTALLGDCPYCDHRSWTRIPALACRVCRRRFSGEELATSGEVEFRRSGAFWKYGV